MEYFRHEKTGNIYRVLDWNVWIEDANAPAVLYQNIAGGKKWVRPKSVFFDGRFEELTPETPR